MTSGESSGRIGRTAYDEAYPRAADALTLYVWRTPAFHLTEWTAAATIPVIAVTMVEALLSALVFWLFWKGHYWPGLLLAATVSLLSTVAMMLSRMGHSHGRANQTRIAIDLIAPLLWWWAWEHGLAAYGRPLEPVYATMVLWVVIGGSVAINVIEGLVLHRHNMQIHAWRPIDTQFRLASAARNANLVILAAALLLFRRPDSGLVLVAWWTLISLIVHAVRFAQLTELQARRQKIASWLDR